MRSALPLQPGQELQLPEIAPLGPGYADTYLGLVYATGSTLTTSGSSCSARDPPRQPVQGRGVWRRFRNQLAGVSCRAEGLVVEGANPPSSGRRGGDRARIPPGWCPPTCTDHLAGPLAPGVCDLRDPGTYRPVPGRRASTRKRPALDNSGPEPHNAAQIHGGPMAHSP